MPTRATLDAEWRSALTALVEARAAYMRGFEREPYLVTARAAAYALAHAIETAKFKALQAHARKGD